MKFFESHLASWGYHSVDARIVGNVRLRRRRGGIRSWPSVKKDIVNHLKGGSPLYRDDNDRLTTGYLKSWPGRELSRRLAGVAEKGEVRCRTRFRTDLVSEMGDQFDARRFVPFVVMHEFEGVAV